MILLPSVQLGWPGGSWRPWPEGLRAFVDISSQGDSGSWSQGNQITTKSKPPRADRRLARKGTYLVSLATR